MQLLISTAPNHVARTDAEHGSESSPGESATYSGFNDCGHVDSTKSGSLSTLYLKCGLQQFGADVALCLASFQLFPGRSSHDRLLMLFSDPSTESVTW
jgi:hypothetical protein